VRDTQGGQGQNATDSLVGTRLVAANTELAEAQNARVAAQTRYQQAAAGDPTGEVLTNTTVQQLRQKLNDLRAEYETKANVMRPEHPEMVDASTRIEALEAALQQETATMIGTLRTNYLAARARENEVVSRINQLQAEVLDLRGRSIQYNIHQREV